MSRTNRRDGAGAHIGEAAGIDDGGRRAIGRVHEQQEAKLGWQSLFVVVYVIADHFDSGQIDRHPYSTPQYVEMAGHRPVGYQVHARLDDSLAATLRPQSLLDRRQNLVIRERDRCDIESIEIGEMQRQHQPAPLPFRH